MSFHQLVQRYLRVQDPQHLQDLSALGDLEQGQQPVRAKQDVWIFANDNAR